MLAIGVFKALLFSPIVGFIGSALMLLAMKALIRNRKLYTAPRRQRAPATVDPRSAVPHLAARCLSRMVRNDGQKGMGLIMLILIGAVPTAYALNRAVPDSHLPAFVQASTQAAQVFNSRAEGQTVARPDAVKAVVTNALKLREVDKPSVYAALATLTDTIAKQVQSYGSLTHVPAAASENIRNGMFLSARGHSRPPAPERAVQCGADGRSPEDPTKAALDDSTKFIPIWVKVSVAIALGLGTMVGWKRIVITVGEKIGKTHLDLWPGGSGWS